MKQSKRYGVKITINVREGELVSERLEELARTKPTTFCTLLTWMLSDEVDEDMLESLAWDKDIDVRIVNEPAAA